MTTTTSEAEAEDQRRRKQRDLDSILDAALDELDEDSDAEEPQQHFEQQSQGGPVILDDGDCDNDDAMMGVPYSLEYLESNKRNDPRRKQESSSSSSPKGKSNRPQFGPEPPPPFSSSSFPPKNSSSSSMPTIPPTPPTMPGMPPFDLPPGMEEELAASLEGMMKQFTQELGDAAGLMNGGADNNAGMPDLSDGALDDMFRKMMMGEHNNAVGGAEGGPSKNTAANDDDLGKNDDAKHSHSSEAATTAAALPLQSTESEETKETTPRNNGNKGTTNNSPTNKKKKEPDVDESINRLLDGINQAASSSSNNNNTMPMPSMDNNIDPAQFENFSQEMMSSLMSQFDKMSQSTDAPDVVDTVMKQLLSKDLMYTPMKEVTQRFPAFLAKHKDELSAKEYERYGTQYQYFQKIIHIYETEPDNYTRLMELMQDVQEYGQPPVEIMKELAPELEFDEEGVPIMMEDGGGAGMGGMMGGMPPGMMPFMAGAGNNNEQCCIS